MKIIKKGEVPEKRVRKTSCRNCKTLFEFTEEEATFVADQRDGDVLNVKCPVCGKDCWVAYRAYP